jgi:transcriptional regulator NrdR family protein
MQCPRCNVWTFVRETRRRSDGSKLRRYQCANDHKFVTVERFERMIEPKAPATVRTPGDSQMLDKVLHL